MEYWIWLQNALGPGARADDIISYFGSPKEFYTAGKHEWILSGVVSRDKANKISDTPLSKSYSIMEECENKSWHIINPTSEHYPPLLKDISSFPLVLYVWGGLDVLLHEPAIAFVGTRNASRYGLDVSRRLAYEVASANVTVVSGGALGVDSSSHRGAIEAGGKTIAFLGCGLGNPYLKQNEGLRQEIARAGAVVSEFPPGFPASKSTFPIRNRLISGISRGVVVIEAGLYSGSLITARYAYSQGRDVFAVPGDIISSNYTGANKLIRDGAKPVFAAYDILNEYINLYPNTIKKIKTAPKYLYPEKGTNEKPEINVHKNDNIINTYTTKPLNDDEKKNKAQSTLKAKAQRQELESSAGEEVKKVYSFLDDVPKSPDFLSDQTGLAIYEVLPILTELEMKGYVEQKGGGVFVASFK